MVTHRPAQVYEHTLLLIKPDGVKRGLVGEILSRFEQAGFKIIAMETLRAQGARLQEHFPRSVEWIEGMGQKTIEAFSEHGIDPFEILGTRDPKEVGAKIKDWNYSYLMEGPIVVVVLEGVHAIEVVRKIIGYTLPYRANPGTIRGDYSSDSPILASLEKRACRNLVHASGDKEEAEREIRCWFGSKEFVSRECSDGFVTPCLDMKNKPTQRKEPAMINPTLEKSFEDSRELNPRKAAEIAYVLARIYIKDGDLERAKHFGRESIGLFDRCPTDTIEQCTPIHNVLHGIVLPDIVHQGVVRDRLSLSGLEI